MKRKERNQLLGMLLLSDYALYCAKEYGRNCAAKFTLKKQVEKDENFIKYLMNLSRTMQKEYFDIEFIKSE